MYQWYAKFPTSVACSWVNSLSRASILLGPLESNLKYSIKAIDIHIFAECVELVEYVLML